MNIAYLCREKMHNMWSLNLRDLGGIRVSDGAMPKGLVLRSGKLSQVSARECRKLVKRHRIGCVIDLRTPIEAAEFPDPLPEGVEYVQIPILKDSTVGFTHELGSDPISILRKLKDNPELMWSLVPDFPKLYKSTVTDDYSLPQLKKVVSRIRQNMEAGVTTLIHCTAGKDRTGIASMALLKEFGASDDDIVRDYMASNRHLFFTAMGKCVGAWLLTRNMEICRIAFHSFTAHEDLIRIAIQNYKV